MSEELERLKSDILKEILGAAKGALPDDEEKEFWKETAEFMAIERIRFVAANTPEEKARVQENLDILKRTTETRLARKKLRARNTAQKVVALVFKVAINKFFPGAGFLVG